MSFESFSKREKIPRLVLITARVILPLVPGPFPRGYPIQSWQGVPHPGQVPVMDGGTPLSRSGPRSGQGDPWVPPPPVQVRSQVRTGGTPQLRVDGGTPNPPPPGRQSSRASACSMADGMLLAFTQEDFLVSNIL